MKIKQLIDEMDRITLSMTNDTAIARNAKTDNEAMGALCDMATKIGELEALYRTAMIFHRRGR